MSSYASKYRSISVQVVESRRPMFSSMWSGSPQSWRRAAGWGRKMKSDEFESFSCKQTCGRVSTYTMKSSMSMDLALFSLNSASCKMLSIFLEMLKSSGTSCQEEPISASVSAQTKSGTGANVHSPRCGQSSEFCSSFPAAAQQHWTC